MLDYILIALLAAAVIYVLGIVTGRYLQKRAGIKGLLLARAASLAVKRLADYHESTANADQANKLRKDTAKVIAALQLDTAKLSVPSGPVNTLQGPAARPAR